MAIIKHTDRGGRPRNRDTILSSKPHRKPLSGARDVLTVDGVPRGYVPRWVNDTGDRILRFLEAGWEFLTTKGVTVGEKTVDQDPEGNIGSVVSKRVGSRDGQPLYAYLMVIEEEFYEEDQKEKYKVVDKTEAAIKAPKEGQYGSVSIQ